MFYREKNRKQIFLPFPGQQCPIRELLHLFGFGNMSKLIMIGLESF